jgi:hypothetical protein
MTRLHGPRRVRLVGRLARVTLAVGLLTLTLGAGSAFADSPRDGGHGHGDSHHRGGFAAVKEATSEFRDLSEATEAGYGLFPGCFSNPAGGMGVHYVQFPSVGDGILDPLKPEALVYEPQAGGRMRLGAVEYIVLADSWTGSAPPSVLGHPLDFVPAPNEFGLPDFYELHVWLFKHNPNGMFNEWNPRVTCDNAG